MIPAIVLAAGRSSRIGRAKALLPVGSGGPTFLEAVLDALRGGGADGLYVVLGGAADEIEARLPPPAGVTYVRNPDWPRGQLTSLRAGLEAADQPSVDGVLVTLIDMPLVAAASVRAVVDAFRRRPDAPIVRATYGGAHGHPVLFARRVFEAVRQANPDVGAREVVHAHAAAVIDVEVPDPGVVLDIDTWEDYERTFGPRPESGI